MSRGAWTGLALFVGSLFVFVLTTAHFIVHTDVWTTNYLSWRISATGNPWIEGLSIPRLDHNPERILWEHAAVNGHLVIGRSPGAVLASLPAYWLARPATMTSWPASVTAAFLTALSVCLFYLSLVRERGPRFAAWAAVVFGFTTPVWSVAANSLWPHTVTILGITGMAWASSRGRWGWMGVFGGIALWGRLHTALIVAVLGLYTAWHRRDARIALRSGATSIGFLVLLSVWTRWIYGTFNPAGSYDSTVLAYKAHESMLNLPNQLGMWIAPDRGILIWTPLLLLLLPALKRAWPTLPDWSRGLFWAGLAYTLLQSALNPFTGGDVFYGYRYGLEFLACSAPAFALAATRAGPLARRLAGPVIGLQLCAITLGATLDSLWLPDYDAWHDNAFIDAGARLGWGVWAALAVIFVVLGTVLGRALIPPATSEVPSDLRTGETVPSA